MEECITHLLTTAANLVVDALVRLPSLPSEEGTTLSEQISIASTYMQLSRKRC